MARQIKTPYVAQVIDYWTDDALAEAIDENELCEPMWTRLLSAAKKSKQDGFVPRGAVLSLGLRHWKKTLPILVKYGIVTEEEGGWRVRSWLNHNDSQQEIEAELERKRANIAAWRERTKPKPDTPPDVTGYETDHRPETNPVRTTVDTRHLTLDPPNGSKTQPKAATQPPATTTRNALFDALATHTGCDLAALTETQARAIGVARAQIAKAGGTPEDIPAAVASYRRQFPGATVTANALANHWGRLRPGHGHTPTGTSPAARMAEISRTRITTPNTETLTDRLGIPR
jgi:hypothetical protein